MPTLYPAAPKPDNEAERLRALHDLGILGTAPDPHFDALCRTAASLFGVPKASVTLVDEHEFWCKAQYGIEAGSGPRDVAICAHAVMSDDVLVVEDTACDPRFSANPHCLGEPAIRFYAGAPLILGPGLKVGTLCIADIVPRRFSPAQTTQLADLALIAVAHLQLQHVGTASRQQADLLAKSHRALQVRERQVREANDFLSLAEQLAHVGHWRIDATTGIVRSSAGFERIFGRTPAPGSVPLTDHVKCIHPEDRDRTRGKIQQLNAGIIDGYENRSRIVRPNGEIRVIISRGLAERAADGRVTAVFGASADVTEAAEVEDQLREQSAILTNTLDNMDEGLFVVGPDQRLVVSNRRGREFFHMSTEWAISHPSLAEAVAYCAKLGIAVPARDMVEDHLASGQHGVRHTRDVSMPDGTIIELRSVWLADGSSIWTCTDVTARREADRALQDREMYYRSLAETVTDIIMRRDVDGTTSYVSPASLDVLGYEADDMRCRSLESLIHPDDIDTFRAASTPLRAGKAEHACVTYRARHRDGRWIWIEGRARLIRDSAGMPTEIISTLRDMTDRIVVDRRLRDSEQRLPGSLQRQRRALGLEPAHRRRLAFRRPAHSDPCSTMGIGVLTDLASNIVHRDDHPGFELAVKEHLEQRAPVMETEFRMWSPTEASNWAWVMARGKVVERTADGAPLRMVGTVTNISARKNAEERIAHLARHDSLTDLPNRAQFHEQLNAQLVQIDRHGGRLAVLCLDLDRFKTINDTMGHPVGDEVLRKVAERLRDTVRTEDLVARLGGDEFAILAPDFDTAHPRRIDALAGRLIERVNQPISIDGHEIDVGLTIGIATAPGDGQAADAVFKRADLALCRGKDEARNTFRFFEIGMDEAMAERRRLEIDLRNAIARGEFELYYQPVMDIGRGRISGSEALLRWRHPERGFVSPADIIPIAEETGLIVPIGEWALGAACLAAAGWDDTSLRVSVNVSALQFRQNGLIDSIVEALRRSGLPAERLELEITESVLIGSGSVVLATVQRIRDLGIHVALDDFGTGYSSLSYLHRFPFDRVKIDRSFVREIGSPKTAAIIRATVNLAQRLGMAVTAEGIETAEQLELVHAEGCVEIQGYLISRPVSAADAMLLARAGPQGRRSPVEPPAETDAMLAG